MRDHNLDATAETKFQPSRQAVERQTESPEARGTFLPQHDPLAQAISRAGNVSSADAHASSLNRATSGRPSRAGQSLLELQRRYGNRYVQRILDLARKGTGKAEAAPEVEGAIQQKRGGGQALDKGVQGQMESAFGADFGDVRVHTDIQADTLNRELNARAFTTGQDIFFRQGAYNPGNSSGRELIAHELTHVVQQNGDKIPRKLILGQPGDKYEQEAHQVARAVMQQEQQPVQRDSDEGLVRRQIEEEEEELQMEAEPTRIQRQAEEEEEEPIAQRKTGRGLIRRQPREEEQEEEPIQAKPKGAVVHGFAKEGEPTEKGHDGLKELQNELKEIRQERGRRIGLINTYQRSVGEADAHLTKGCGIIRWRYNLACESFGKIFSQVKAAEKKNEELVGLILSIAVGAAVSLAVPAAIPAFAALRGWKMAASAIGEETFSVLVEKGAQEAFGGSSSESAPKYSGQRAESPESMFQNVLEKLRRTATDSKFWEMQENVLDERVKRIQDHVELRMKGVSEAWSLHTIENQARIHRRFHRFQSKSSQLLNEAVVNLMKLNKLSFSEMKDFSQTWIEQDIWIMWMSSFKRSDIGILSHNIIRKHLYHIHLLGPVSRLLIDPDSMQGPKRVFGYMIAIKKAQEEAEKIRKRHEGIVEKLRF